MSDYIKKDKLIELLRNECAEVDDGNRDIDESTCLVTFRAMHEFIDMIPTADVKPVVRGEWIKWGSEYKCNKCHLCNPFQKPYCPNCGADMRGEDNQMTKDDLEIYNSVIERYKRIGITNRVEIVIELEKEIIYYRKRIRELEDRL